MQTGTNFGLKKLYIVRQPVTTFLQVVEQGLEQSVRCQSNHPPLRGRGWSAGLASQPPPQPSHRCQPSALCTPHWPWGRPQARRSVSPGKFLGLARATSGSSGQLANARALTLALYPPPLGWRLAVGRWLGLAPWLGRLGWLAWPRQPVPWHHLWR